jgi:hypothetical protein
VEEEELVMKASCWMHASKSLQTCGEILARGEIGVENKETPMTAFLVEGH